MSAGTEAIRKYFSLVKGSGNKNTIQERHTIVLDDNAVVVTGFYEFTRMKDGSLYQGRPVSPCLSPSAMVNGISLITILRHTFHLRIDAAADGL